LISHRASISVKQEQCHSLSLLSEQFILSSTDCILIVQILIDLSHFIEHIAVPMELNPQRWFATLLLEFSWASGIHFSKLFSSIYNNALLAIVCY